MASTSPREDLTVNPAVRATDANKDLSLRNFQARSRWAMTVKKLDIQRREREHEIAEEQQKLLKYREKLQNTTLSLPPAKKEDETDERVRSKSMSFFDVYRSLMAVRNGEQHEMNEAEDGNNNSPREGRKSRGTFSSEQKRVVRKRFSYSLGDLQKAKNSSQNKTELETSTTIEEPSEEEKAPSRASTSLFSLTEDDEALGPLRLPPTSLPKIYQQPAFKPRSRSFDKDDTSKTKIRGEGSKIEDVRYCRYLRTTGGGKRRNTAPPARFAQLSRNPNRTSENSRKTSQDK